MTKILIIIQRSNGDVFLSAPLINALCQHYNAPQIDLLINDDTLSIAKTLQHIHTIFLYKYSWRKDSFYKRICNEFSLIKTIYSKYDISISLTASDRSVLYAALSSKNSTAVIENQASKTWWKRLLLKNYYFFDATQHIIQNNMNPLKFLDIPTKNSTNLSTLASQKDIVSIKTLLNSYGITQFIIFHPSAQYAYKTLNTQNRNSLLELLSTLNIPIVVTGANSTLDCEISDTLLEHKNIYNFIGKTSLGEYIALSHLSQAYIGMDTLNMHIAAAQNKRVFAIFGPTLTSMWSPWDNQTGAYDIGTPPCYTYGAMTIFQANLPCVPCGKAGCDNKHGKSDCLAIINPNTIFQEVQKWLK